MRRFALEHSVIVCHCLRMAVPRHPTGRFRATPHSTGRRPPFTTPDWFSWTSFAASYTLGVGAVLIQASPHVVKCAGFLLLGVTPALIVKAARE